MNPISEQTLQRVAEKVFESLAFVLPAMDDDAPPADDAITTAVVGFSGPVEGKLELRVSTVLLPEIAANMLGLEFDQSPSADQQGDAFGELLNVICGNLLPSLCGDEAVFDLQKPHIRQDAPADTPEGLSPVATACLALEGGQALLTLYAPDGAPNADARLLPADAAEPEGQTA